MKRLRKKANDQVQAYAQQIKGMTDVIDLVCDNYGDKNSEYIIDGLAGDGEPRHAITDELVGEYMEEEIIDNPDNILEDLLNAVASKMDQGFAAVKNEVETALYKDEAFIKDLAVKASMSAWGPSDL